MSIRINLFVNDGVCRIDQKFRPSSDVLRGRDEALRPLLVLPVKLGPRRRSGNGGLGRDLVLQTSAASDDFLWTVEELK